MMNIRGLAFDDPQHTVHLKTMELEAVDAYFQDMLEVHDEEGMSHQRQSV